MSMHARCVKTVRAPNDPFLWGENGATQQTLAIIKPDCVGVRKVEDVLPKGEEGDEPAEDAAPAEDVVAENMDLAIKARVVKEGFKIARERRVRLSKAQAQAFYKEHAGREFYEGLTDFMCSGPVIVMVLEKEGAIRGWRELIGNTNSELAREEAEALNPLDTSKWTLRAAFGTDNRRNAVHGSDSVFSAAREINFFFGENLKLERTCAVITPEAVKAGKVDEIVDTFCGVHDYAVVGRVEKTCTPDEAAGYFPASWTNEATALASGPCVVLCLERLGAIGGMAVALGPVGKEIGGVSGGVYGATTAEAASAQIHYWFKEPLVGERTLALIKPGTADESSQAILSNIRKQGFLIVEQQRLHLTQERAGMFYQEHKGKSFYNRLTKYMSSGPLIALVLSKPGAIKAWRTLMGPTNTFVARKQKPNCLRARYGKDGTQNATHGSDSEASAFREISFFFPHHAGRSAKLLTGDSARDYLATKRCTEEKTMNQVLVDGLVALCKAKPVGPAAIRYLGKWLIENNPARPGAKAPEPAYAAAPPAPATAAAMPAAQGAAASEYPNAGARIAVPEETSKSIVFMMGGPGAGKGTQCKRVAAEFGYTHLSTGDLLRAEVAKGTEMGKALQETMSAGQLVSDDTVMALLKQAMADSGSNKFLIDGYPRVLPQAWAFEQEIGVPSMVLSFGASDETMTQRLVQRGISSGRADDNEETIKKRLVTFHEQTDPTIDFYDKLGLLRRISAEGLDREQVYEATRKHFQPQSVFVVGPPGAGKGTVSQSIMDKYGYEHLSSGDLLRAEIARGSKVGTKIDRLSKNGQLVPDDVTLKVLKRAMDKSTSSKFLVDGFPRTMAQAKAYEREIGPCKFVLHVTADEAVCRSRLLDRNSKKDDDTAGAFFKRMKTYREKTMPVVEMYSGSNSVRACNGNGTAEETYAAAAKFFRPTVAFVVSSGGVDNGRVTARMAAASGYTHLVPGNLLRGEMSRKSAEGIMLQNMTTSGQIIPVDVTHGLIQKAMTASGNDRFIIDMYPRALDQATAFEKQICACSKVLYLKMSEEKVVAAHAEKGLNSDQVARRVRTFNSQTVPVMNYYGIQGRVVTIDGDAGDDEILSAGKAALDPVVVIAAGKGKSAHTAALASQFAYVNVNMESIVDCEIARGGALAGRLSAAREAGESPSSTDCLSLLKSVMAANHSSNQFLLSGYPRSAEESAAFESIAVPRNALCFLPDYESPEVEAMATSYSERGMLQAISGEGTATEVYNRASQSFRPTLTLCMSKKFDSRARVMTQVCLASGASRIKTTELLLAEAESGSANGKIIAESMAAGRTVPVDITIGLINNVVKSSPTTKFVVEGFPRLVSAGFPGVQDQLAALQSQVGDVVQLINLDIADYSGADASIFRLEKEPVVKYFDRVNRMTSLDMTSEDDAATSAVCDSFATYFDAEARAAIRAKYLSAIEDEERKRREEAELGGEEEEVQGEEEEADE